MLQSGLWALVDPYLAPERREIEIVGTGVAVDDSSRTYISTVQLHGGSFVLHIFEII